MNNYTYTRQAIHRNVWAAIWPEISSEWYVNLLLVNNAVFLTNMIAWLPVKLPNNFLINQHWNNFSEINNLRNKSLRTKFLAHNTKTKVIKIVNNSNYYENAKFTVATRTNLNPNQWKVLTRKSNFLCSIFAIRHRRGHLK